MRILEINLEEGQLVRISTGEGFLVASCTVVSGIICLETAKNFIELNTVTSNVLTTHVKLMKELELKYEGLLEDSYGLGFDQGLGEGE
jgi:hypothetical protein